MSETEKQARAFVDAANHGDFDTALALLADNGLSFTSWGIYTGPALTAHDKATVRRDALEYFAGLGGAIEIKDCATKGTGLACSILARDDYRFKARCGLDVYHMQLTVKPKDGKIQLMSFQPARADDDTCIAADPKFKSWAEANRADEWNKIKSAAAYGLTGRSLGEAESAMCKAYLESQK